ncbi:MAG: hypothetical protein KDC84_04075 [Crocinitomicaceae bacterium]|nr:hypothetical protein [Crocinitomicaceae bacterium]
MMIRLLALSLILFSCGESVQDDSKKTKTPTSEKETIASDSSQTAQETTSTPQTIHFDKDSLIQACESFIIDTYKSNIGEDDFGKDIQVKGSVSFENDAFLVLQFEEIIEYGSWMYSSSSMFFNKSRGRLEKVKVDSKMDPNWEVTKNLYYMGRVNGDVQSRVMLNGDDLPDFIMSCSQSFRTNESIWENIYELDLKNNYLKMYDLSTSSSVIRGDCEGGEYGNQRRFKIKDTKSDLPIIEIVVSESECLEGEVQVEERPSMEYQWDPNQKKFMKIR